MPPFNYAEDVNYQLKQRIFRIYTQRPILMRNGIERPSHFRDSPVLYAQSFMTLRIVALDVNTFLDVQNREGLFG